MRLRLSDLQLDEMLAETVKRLTPLAGNRDINLTLEAHAAPVVEGDSSKIQQVFYNLIDNAIKYTPAGGDVRVELGENARFAIIKVSDTGIGIPQADIALSRPILPRGQGALATRRHRIRPFDSQSDRAIARR